MAEPVDLGFQLWARLPLVGYAHLMLAQGGFECGAARTDRSCQEDVLHNLQSDIDLPWGSEPWTELGWLALDYFNRTLK